ncbi:proline racemase [Kiloniella litopenaei]|uniref:Proline racemase n=1 Tax=Kiloniella litopenaei TaxID=1549748 RepID=A0A0M2R8N5_9PROT|nr:proline racemase family protein [Kiloniella litopenaei]KKJ76340.1 proline racemase [Kiloniella litopenaei]
MRDVRINTIEMHTGGEPLRIITSGYPEIKGNSILEKRRFVRDNLDNLRQLLMFEPRGHYDMYGALLVEPCHPEADLGVLFLHNEGYSTMCGHAVIALGRYAVDQGIVKAVEPTTTVKIECPCGLVIANVDVKDGQSGAVSFLSVPAFAFSTDQNIDVPGYGTVKYDIGYGGAFYGLVSAKQLGLDVHESSTRDLVQAADKISTAIKENIKLSHPESNDLAFLYGTILTDGKDTFSNCASANICVFADKQVDRSPTGSGVTARIAVQMAKSQISKGQTRQFESVTKSLFEATAEEVFNYGPHQAVRVRVKGKAHYTGESVFTLEQDDRIGKGFLLK